MSNLILERRYAILEVSIEVLESLLKTGVKKFEVVEGLPEDAKIADMQYDSIYDKFLLKIVSAEFEKGIPGHEIKRINVVFKDIDEPKIRITADVVDKVKQEAENSPNIPIEQLHTVGKIIYPRTA